MLLSTLPLPFMLVLLPSSAVCDRYVVCIVFGVSVDTGWGVGWICFVIGGMSAAT